MRSSATRRSSRAPTRSRSNGRSSMRCGESAVSPPHAGGMCSNDVSAVRNGVGAGLAVASSVVEIERDLAELRDASGAPGQGPVQRTSVMTHLAWVPPDLAEAAERTLAGLAEQHPSRTILLFPRPEDDDALDLDASVQCFAFGERAVCAEVIRVQLCGTRAHHPASVVVPMLI